MANFFSDVVFTRVTVTPEQLFMYLPLGNQTKVSFLIGKNVVQAVGCNSSPVTFFCTGTPEAESIISIQTGAKKLSCRYFVTNCLFFFIFSFC
jgi:hypothetical protein